MLRRVAILEEVSARGWKIEGQKRRVTREEYEILREEFEAGVFMVPKGLWNIAKKRMLEDRGVVPKEDGNQLREEKAMHEENFLSSWLWEDVEGEKEEMGKLKEESGQEGSKSGNTEMEGERREVEKKRICLEHLPSQVFGEHHFIPEVEIVGISFWLSVCVLEESPSVPDVTVPCFSAKWNCEVSHDSDCDFVEPQICLSRENAKRFLLNVKKT